MITCLTPGFLIAQVRGEIAFKCPHSDKKQIDGGKKYREADRGFYLVSTQQLKYADAK